MGNIRHNLLNHLGELGWLPQEYSSEEDTGTVTAVGDLVAPKTPTNVTASNGTERIKIEWDKVTYNADDSDCNDLWHYNVYYSASSGIDTNNDLTYDGVETRNTLTWSQEVSPGNTKYYVVTAEDQTRNESSASSEVSATSRSVTVNVDISDYTDNFSDIQVGDGIIGLIFRQPNSGWDGYSHYKLYRDELGGSSWTSIFEGPNPAYVDKGVSSGANYKYKLTFVDVDGGETNGTVQDNSGSGYNPNNADNSNITAQTFLAPNIVAQNEVRGNSLYAESQIILGGVDGSGYIKSSNYTPGSDGFKINASGDAKFNNVTVRGQVEISSGSGIGNLSDAGLLAEYNPTDINHTGDTAPSNPDEGWLWRDTSANPDELKRYNGSSWEVIATLGADWDNNLVNIPDRHTNSATTGLNLTANYLGYYDGTWQAYIKGSDGSGQLAGGDISWDGTGNAQIEGSLTVTGGSGIGNFTDAGNLAEENVAKVSNSAVAIDGDLTVTGNLKMAAGDVQLGASVPDGGGGTQEGLYIKNGGAYIEDVDNRVIFNSNGEFSSIPNAYNLALYVTDGSIAAQSWKTIATLDPSVTILGGIVAKAEGDADKVTDFQVEASDDSGSTTMHHSPHVNAGGSSTGYNTWGWSNPALILPLPMWQTQGTGYIKVYNPDTTARYYQALMWAST